MRLVLATHNDHKKEEISLALKDLPFEIVTQKNLNIEAIEETGSNFLDNAILKANHAYNETKANVLADDSGIVVPVLGNVPGVHSARYAGEQASCAENNEKLLHALKQYEGADRKAFFVCVLVYMIHNEKENTAQIYTIEKSWHGIIATKPEGKQGFGYDPIFIPVGKKKPAATLSKEEKNIISHRGQALQAIREIMQSLLHDNT